MTTSPRRGGPQAMFTLKDVAEYYNTTQVHYERWWDLKSGLSLHYGIWDEGVRDFASALMRTNQILMDVGNIRDGENILDAGCGVGGSAVFLARNRNVKVTGISLSEKQVAYARKHSREQGQDTKVSFEVQDYGHTSFKSSSFDVVWACESLSSAPDIGVPFQEACRVLKPGGRIILSDFFLTPGDHPDPHRLIQKWQQTWSISGFQTADTYIKRLTESGFEVKEVRDYTLEIHRTALRMYRAAWLGAIPSEIYNFFHPRVSRFAKKHYQCGYYQYKALKEGLWEYKVICANLTTS